MTKYVLIFFLFDPWGAAGLSAEFETQAACENSVAEFLTVNRDKLKDRERFEYYWSCEPKGNAE